MGWESLPRFPYIAEQSFGVYTLGCFAVALWTGRAYFTRLGRHLFSGASSPSQLDDSHEPMSYRSGVCVRGVWHAFLDESFPTRRVCRCG